MVRWASSALPSWEVSATFKNILIIRPSALGDVARTVPATSPSALGDVARTVPALASLRAACPAARIDWVVEDGMEGVIEAHPALTSVVTFPKRDIKAAAKRLNPVPLFTFRQKLRSARYDAVFDLQGLARSAVMTYATGAPVRVGLAGAREMGWLAYTHKSPAPITMHTVKRMLEVVRAGGIEPIDDMRLYTTSAADAWARVQPWYNYPYAVLAPTSRWPAKQWPQDRFAAVAQWLTGLGVRVVVVGGKSERAQCPALIAASAKNNGITDCIGATSVPQMMAAIKNAALVIANDSAALHIAVGFSRPLVALFGPTRVDRVGPFQRAADVIQHIVLGDDLGHKVAANVRLMERIGVEEVIAKSKDRLEVPAARVV